ncbi:MAG: hypothetical protein Q9219_001949 [cf. Caloplaca sp. 3 TL-2023]
MPSPPNESDMSDDLLEPNTLDDEDEWRDIEPDYVVASYIGFGGNTTFRDIREFLVDAKENHDIDLIEMRNTNNLDTFGMIKLINYVRAQMNRGLFRPDMSPQSFLEGDQYLKPVLEDDALLYSIDDLFDLCEHQEKVLSNDSAEVTFSHSDVQEMIKENKKLREQATYYRSSLRKSFLENLELKEQSLHTLHERDGDHSANTASARETVDSDSHYFSSYAYNDIHEVMLQDRVRTDAYRDFIYDNKHLFAGKIILDVGCGTGILSLFCVKAGAAKVIAVDNSAIIDKAREIIFENGLDACVWMGYCLLYEAMLDSVIWARDRYLDTNGLMIPSHATLRLSLFTDDDYVSDKVTFWNSVYGFKMSCMLAKAYDDIVIRTVKPDTVVSQSVSILELPLHTVQKEHLTLNGASFKLAAEQSIDQLHGFLFHFDIFFTTNRGANISEARNSFTTGPLGLETHWQQALALIDSSKHNTANLKVGDHVYGNLMLRKGAEYFRELQIKVTWGIKCVNSDGEQPVSVNEQTWAMR